MKKLLFVLIAVLLGITSCDKAERESEEVLIEMGIFDDWTLYRYPPPRPSDSVFTDLRIAPPNKFELLNHNRVVISGKISVHESEQLSCTFSFYPGRHLDKEDNLGWFSQSRLLGCSYLLLNGDTLEIRYPPMVTFTHIITPEYYFTRTE